MKTRSINARLLCGTQLMGVDFNSAVSFNGKTYFCSMQSGITKEEGGRDGQLDIKAWVIFPTTDMGILQPKALRTLILSGRIGGQVAVTVESEKIKESYLSPKLDSTTGVRMKIDRDLRGWLQRIKVGNHDGCSMNISKANITIIPGTEYRR
jgi:hypothetical protein